MVRYCKHSKLSYIGMLAERDLGYASVFMDDEKSEHVKAFADQVLTALRRSSIPCPKKRAGPGCIGRAPHGEKKYVKRFPVLPV